MISTPSLVQHRFLGESSDLIVHRLRRVQVPHQVRMVLRTRVDRTCAIVLNLVLRSRTVPLLSLVSRVFLPIPQCDLAPRSDVVVGTDGRVQV